MKINIHMFIFLFFAILASVNDIITYFLKLNYNISLVISLVLVIALGIFLIKKNKIKIFNNFEKKDLIFLIPFFLIYSILFLACDEKFDVRNYHIYNQQSFFNDKINFDYLPNSSTFFPLGDKIFYIFRYFLGFRLGTIISHYTLIVLFYQMKSILTVIIPDITSKKRLLFSSIILLTVTPHLRNAGYHVDNFSIILLLELLNIFINGENVIENKKILYYCSLILGFSIGIKIINAIIGAVIVLAILISTLAKNKLNILKSIKIRDIVICGILCILPFFVYMLHNYFQTGNPIFPFLNNAFKSEYYKEVTGRDKYFGVPSVFTSFIWPIIINIYPYMGYDEFVREPLWGGGYIIAIITLLLRNEKKDKIWRLSFLGILLSNVWAISLNGYIRYALILPILFYIIVVVNFIELTKEKVKKISFKTLYAILIVVLLSYSVFEGTKNIRKKIKIAYDHRIDFENYYVPEEKYYEIDGVWASINFNSALIELIRNPETPMYNLDLNRDVNSTETSYSLYAREKLIEKLSDKKIYTLIPTYNYEITVELLKEDGFEFVSEPIEYTNSKIQNPYDKWYIAEIKYSK